VIFDAFRLPPPQVQADVFTGVNVDFDSLAQQVSEYHEYKVDFLWRHQKTIAETDGLMKYTSGKEAIQELKRDRLLREAGFKVVHITWAELLGRPQRIIDRILRAFEATSAY